MKLVHWPVQKKAKLSRTLSFVSDFLLQKQYHLGKKTKEVFIFKGQVDVL